MINGNGELVGLAFDSNWEGMTGDIEFAEKIQKKYALFIYWQFTTPLFKLTMGFTTSEAASQAAKMSFPTLLKFAVRNLLATPKKLIFIMLMQILVVAVFTLVYTNQISNIREIGLEQSYVYPSVPDTRLLIEKRDGTEFTITEISLIKNRMFLVLINFVI